MKFAMWFHYHLEVLSSDFIPFNLLIGFISSRAPLKSGGHSRGLDAEVKKAAEVLEGNVAFAKIAPWRQSGGSMGNGEESCEMNSEMKRLFCNRMPV